jgi:hypothetical protein
VILEVGAQAPAFYLFNWAVDFLLLNFTVARGQSPEVPRSHCAALWVKALQSSHAALFGLDSKRRALRARRLLSIAVLEGLVFQ